MQGGSLGQALKAGLISAVTAVAFQVAGGITANIADGGAALSSGQFGAGFGTTAHIFKIASHAAIGCLSAMAGGGKCGAGALSAGVSAGATPFYHTGSDAGNVAVAALVGGAASKLGGGSFADGAATAAFGYLFNAFAHRKSRTIYVNPRDIGEDAHEAFQKYARNQGYLTEVYWGIRSLISGRLDVANSAGSFWEIKPNTFTGRLAGLYDLDWYERHTNYKRGEHFPVPSMPLRGHYGYYRYHSTGDGLILHSVVSIHKGVTYVPFAGYYRELASQTSVRMRGMRR